LNKPAFGAFGIERDMVGGAGVCAVVSLGILTSRKRVRQKIDWGSLGASNAKMG